MDNFLFLFYLIYNIYFYVQKPKWMLLLGQTCPYLLPLINRSLTVENCVCSRGDSAHQRLDKGVPKVLLQSPSLIIKKRMTMFQHSSAIWTRRCENGKHRGQGELAPLLSVIRQRLVFTSKTAGRLRRPYLNKVVLRQGV